MAQRALQFKLFEDDGVTTGIVSKVDIAAANASDIEEILRQLLGLTGIPLVTLLRMIVEGKEQHIKHATRGHLVPILRPIPTPSIGELIQRLKSRMNELSRQIRYLEDQHPLITRFNDDRYVLEAWCQYIQASH